MLGALVILGLTSGFASAAGSGGVKAGARVVATVESVTGTSLWVLRASGSTVSPLRTGGEIELGDIVAAGPGVEGKFKLSRPSGTPAGTELFSVYKQLASGPPTAAEMVKEFGVLSGAATVIVRRSGGYVYLTFAP